MNEQRNLWVAIASAVVILIGWQFFFAPEPDPQVREAQVREQLNADGTNTPQVSGPAVPGGQPAVPAVKREDALAESPRIKIDTPRVEQA